MATEAQLGAAFLLALVAVLATTPVAIRVATRIAFYDRPEGYKAHAAPTPYLGGAAVITAIIVGMLPVAGDAFRLWPAVLGISVLLVVGTLDDRHNVPPLQRLVVTAAVAVLLSAGGLGWSIFHSDAANVLLTVFWVVALVNACNLMDNMDGAAATVAAVSGAGLASYMIIYGEPAFAVLAFALCGACLGFLYYNLAAPSRIFLGDGGSMPIGFVLATITMSVDVDAALTWRPLVAAALFVGLVIFDTLLVIGSRQRRQVPIYRGGRDHLTHRLAVKLGSARAVVTLLGAMQAALCVLAVVAATGSNSAALGVGVISGVAAVAFAVVLEFGQLGIVATRSAAPSPFAPPSSSRNTRMRVAQETQPVALANGRGRPGD